MRRIDSAGERLPIDQGLRFNTRPHCGYDKSTRSGNEHAASGMAHSGAPPTLLTRSPYTCEHSLAGLITPVTDLQY